MRRNSRFRRHGNGNALCNRACAGSPPIGASWRSTVTGGTLFDLSVLGTVAQTSPSNLCILVFDNEGYVSTGKAELRHLAHCGDRRHRRGCTRSGTGECQHSAFSGGIRQRGRKCVWCQFRAEFRSSPRSARSKRLSAPCRWTSRKTSTRFVRHLEQTESKIILRPSAKEHGEAPKADPAYPLVSGQEEFGRVLFDGLCENKVDFVIGLPCSGLSAAQSYCLQEPSVRYVGVAHEGTGFGLGAGAWAWRQAARGTD